MLIPEFPDPDIHFYASVYIIIHVLVVNNIVVYIISIAKEAMYTCMRVVSHFSILCRVRSRCFVDTGHYTCIYIHVHAVCCFVFCRSLLLLCCCCCSCVQCVLLQKPSIIHVRL